MITVECLCCGHVQPINESDGFQVCDMCEQVFPVSESDIVAQATQGEPPVGVIRGVVNPAPRLNMTRALADRKNAKVFLDYLSFTLPPNAVPGYGDHRLVKVFELLNNSMPELTADIRNKGMFGYTHSAALYIAGEQVGLIATGGNSGTTYVQLSGHATAWLNPRAWAGWLEESRARINRVDLAHDDYLGTRTVDSVREAYLADQFKSRGQNPTSSAVGPWDDPTQWDKGRTYYIGKRENGKMLRVYEKGKQLGKSDSPWVRFEVEFRRQKDKPLPPDMLRRMEGYFSGAYAWLEWVSAANPTKLDRVKQEVKISYESLVNYARTAYGKLIHVMKTVCDTPDQIIEALRVEGVPKRLQMGVLPNV
jgi:DNA relaxase NicK